MGQGLGVGAVSGGCATAIVMGMKLTIPTHLSIFAAFAAAGLTVDLLSDVTARTGQVVIERDVVLQATDVLRHLYSYYAESAAHPMSKFIRQKHEWLVLESHTNKFYVAQKSPKTGDVLLQVRDSLRAANDLGLSAAARPMHTGEIRQQRMDQEFDLPNDLQVAYLIAWVRKEDPRWALTTENSKHFAMRLRLALNDF